MPDPDNSHKSQETGIFIAKIILCFLLIILLVLAFGGILQFLWFKHWFNWLSDKIATATGINIWLARTLAIGGIAAVPVVFRAFSPQILPDWVHKHFPKKRKQYAWYQSLVIFAVGCLLMYAFTKDNLFGKYYLYDAVNDQIVLFDSGGIDQKTTMEKRPVDSPQIAQEIRLFMASQKIKTGPARFFDDRGIPFYRYYRNDDKTIEIYPTFLRIHPKYGTPMEPISGEIVKEYEAQKAVLPKMSAEKVEGVGFRSPPQNESSTPLRIASLKHIAIAIQELVDGTQNVDVIQSVIIEKLQESGYRVTKQVKEMERSKTDASSAGILIKGTAQCKTSDLGDKSASLGYQNLGQAAKGITVAETQLKLEIINNNTRNSLFVSLSVPQGKPNSKESAIQESLASCAQKAKEQILDRIQSISKSD